MTTGTVTMNKLAIVCCLILVSSLVFLPVLLPANQQVAEKGLPQQYQEWLSLVAYHIQPVERDVFMQLTNNRDRDLFIETFWKQRDPTPGTPEIEYKDELLKRFQHVSQFYGRSTTREGWKTDMGRIYMVLGPPASIERFEATIGLVPCQSWSYYGDSRRGLPPQFFLLFYQRGGVGEYKLYDPVADGPARLLLNQRDIEDPFDHAELYEKIKALAPTLAEISVTRIPGEYSFDFSPSPRNAILLADILDSPRKDVNPAYATHFLDYKGIVSTEYLTNYVESDAMTALIQDPVTGLRFLHFSIAPVNVNVDYYDPKSQFYCNFQVNVSLRDGQDIIFQYNREFPLYFPENEWDRIKANGLAIEDSFPIAEGKHKLNILLTNTVGKQFSLLEKDIDVPPAGTASALEGPVVGYKFETYERDVHIPFKVVDQKLDVDPKKTFSKKDGLAVFFNVLNVTEDLYKGGQAKIAMRGLRETNPILRTYTVKLDTYPVGPILSIFRTIPAGDLEPDYYEIGISLIGPDGKVIAEKQDSFAVSPAAAVGHPIAKARRVPPASQFLYRYMLAQQAEKMNRPEAARPLYEEAHRLNPEYKEGLVMYGNFLNKTGAFEEALQVAEGLRQDDRRQFAFHAIRGQALLGQGKPAEALPDLLDANKLYNSETNVLNSLGKCYARMGRKEEALEALKASLKLNPKQDDIKKLLGELQK